MENDHAVTTVNAISGKPSRMNGKGEIIAIVSLRIFETPKQVDV